MKTKSTAAPRGEHPFGTRVKPIHHRWQFLLVGLMVLALTGCKSPTTQSKEATTQAASQLKAITLREGDVVRVTFPGTSNLDTAPQQIRRDGNIALPLIGEIKVVGMTPGELEKELINRYATELVSKKVTVTLVSSSYVVYVTGLVLRPGKITSDHPISALEAIMEAGGVDYNKANLKAVTVTRIEGGSSKNYKLNLKSVLKGGKGEIFYLKPSDIVYVPERFTWF